MSDGKKTVLVWVPDVPKERAGLPSFRGAAEVVLKPIRVEAEQIGNSLRDLVQAIEPTLSTSLSKSGLSVDEVELNLTVSGDGEVGFISSVSAGIKASITVKLKRHAQ